MPVRTPANPSARLAILRASRKKAKKADIVAMSEMAKILGMTPRNLKITINGDPDLPILSRGAEGIAYQFNVIAVLDHLIARCLTAIGIRNKQAARMARLSGVDVSLDLDASTDTAPLTTSEIRELGQGQITAQKLKMMQMQFVRADGLASFLDTYHGHFQSNTLGLMGKIDPAGQLPAATRLLVEDGMRNLLVELQNMMDRFLDGLNVPARA